MVNISATDCSISLEFGTEFEHVTLTLDELQKFKVKGSKVKVTASRNAGDNLLYHQ